MFSSLARLTESPRRLKGSITGGIVLVLAITLGFLDRWIERNRPDEAGSDANRVAVEQATAINDFLGDKDEYHLQELFAVGPMRDLNVRIVRDRVLFYQQHRPDERFDIEPYKAEGDTLMLSSKYGRLAPQGGASRYEPLRGAIGAIVVPRQYLESKALLIRYLHSGTLPTPILQPLKQFDLTVEDNSSKLFDALNEALEQSPDDFLQHDDPGSPMYKLVDKEWHDRFTPLEPKAEAVIKSVRDFLRI